MPLVSVLLPVRDAAPWLASSLASLRRQTFEDFEIVAVNDGSRDESGVILDAVAAREPRMRVIHAPARGLPRALQTALAEARGTWIARHDADDLSHRRRFELQAAWLDGHRGDAVVGTRVRLFPERAFGAGMARWIRWHNRLLSHEAMVAEMLIDSPLAHGSAMVRRSALERAGGWREKGWAEDLDLWIRMREAGARFAKLPEVLYGWRQHPGSATRRDPRYAPERFLALKCDALARGFLAGRRVVHVFGTGRSLERWTVALEERGFDVTARVRRAAGPPAARDRPLVLVYGIAEVRERWRNVLRASDMEELRDFMFVS